MKIVEQVNYTHHVKRINKPVVSSIKVQFPLYRATVTDSSEQVLSKTVKLYPSANIAGHSKGQHC